MIQRQDERRGFIRMAIESQVEWRRPGERHRFEGRTRDLSATGVRFVTEGDVARGEILEVVIHPGAAITPALERRLRVLRVSRDDDSGLYEVAGALEEG